MSTLDLLSLDFVRNALIAGVVLAVLSGLLGPVVVGRGMAFSVHGTAELAFAGGAGALLVFGTDAVGWGALVGAVLVALLFGALGRAQRERDSVIGVLLSFGLGLGVLFQSLYTGRSANKFGLLVGQIVGVDVGDVLTLAIVGVVVLGVFAVVRRPLLFASLDPEVAAARGVPVRALSIVFAVLLGVTVALGVQIVGALLVLCLLITPAAAAAQVTASPTLASVLAVVFAEVAVIGGHRGVPRRRAADQPVRRLDRVRDLRGLPGPRRAADPATVDARDHHGRVTPGLDFGHAAIIVVAGVWAGMVNTIVGSGTLVTFPVLLALGYPPLTANVSNGLGLVPGSLTGAIGYRRELRGLRGRVVRLGVASVLGGLTGAVLLLWLPPDAFDAVVPVLVALAVVLVVIQPWVSRRMAARRPDGAPRTRVGPAVWSATYGTGVYGGYFGAAQGVLLLATLGLLIDDDLQRHNAVKNVLATLANLVSGIVFALVAPVSWPVVACVAGGSIVGGVIGSLVGRRLPPVVLRGVIVVVGVAALVQLLLR